MIERVLVRGADVELGEVLAALTIRHGRGSVDDGPLASTASLTLVGVTRERVSAFSVGDTLELELADGVPRFRGRITDARLSSAGLELVAVSDLARLAGRNIGYADWPEEPWAARILRVFEDADVLLDWREIPGTWAGHGGTWAELGLTGRLTFEHADDGPPIAARAASQTTLGGYLAGDFRASEEFAAASLPDGSVLVQQLSTRAGRPELELDADRVLWAPEFEQADSVENDVELAWAGGNVYADVPRSIARFEARRERTATELARLGDATTAAAVRAGRRAFPRWQAAPLELLELEPAITIGTPVRIHRLPEWAPSSAYLGIVEGWEDRLEAADGGGLSWSMRLYLSDPRLSGGFGTLWFTVEPARSWAEAPPATWIVPDPLQEAA